MTLSNLNIWWYDNIHVQVHVLPLSLIIYHQARKFWIWFG